MATATKYHVCSHNAFSPISWCFSGTRAECKRFMRSRGNAAFYFITTMTSMDKIRRRYGN